MKLLPPDLFTTPERAREFFKQESFSGIKAELEALTEPPKESKAPFYILSCDGGALKGAIAAELLMLAEKYIGHNINTHFKMFAGSSTGSIIATALACGISTKELVNLYTRVGPVIFKKEKYTSIDAIKKLTRILRDSVYSNDTLAKHLNFVLKDITFANVKDYLVIPYANLSSFEASCFTNTDQSANNVRVADAVLCSCAAPILFRPVELDGKLMCDGGMFANNPALIAVMRAHKDLNIPFERIKVLSLGCGHCATPYKIKPDMTWGILGDWEGMKLVDSLFYIQHNHTNNLVKELIGKENFFDLECETKKVYNLDNPNEIIDMELEADAYYAHIHYDLMEFLGIKRK